MKTPLKSEIGTITTTGRNLLGLFLAMVGCVAFILPASASCGLDHCPVVRPQAEEPVGVRLQTRAQHTGFDLGGVEGRYSELFLSAEYRALEGWSLGGNLPLISLEVEGESRLGVGNSVLYGEWRHSSSAHTSFAVGNQIEFPWGTGEGLSDDHWVFLPYVSAHIPLASLFLMAHGGFAQSVGGHSHEHEAGAAPDTHDLVFVNPHESQEIVGRFALGAPLLEGRLQLMATFNGQHALAGDGDRSFLQSGARVLFRTSDTFALHGLAEFPITEAKRFEHRVMFGAIFDL